MATFMVTGCNRGIGLGLSQKILREGHQLIGTCRRINGSRDLWELQSHYPDDFKVLEFDVTGEQQVADALKTLPEGQVIDILVNNAGILLEYGEGLEALTISAMEKSFRVNTLGPIIVMRQCLPFLKRSKAPKVFNVSSKVGSIADNSTGHAYAYRTSKSALNMVTKNLALEYPDWPIIGLHPGWVATDMGGRQAPTQVEESADGLYMVIQNAETSQSGLLIDFQGDVIPW